MKIDINDSKKVVVNLGNWHHKIFLAERILDGMGAESDGEESHNNRKTSYREGILQDRKKPDTPVLEPGHIIKFYMPGKPRNDEWVRVAIVYSSTSDFIPGRYYIHTTFHCPLPNHLPVRIVGKLGD